MNTDEIVCHEVQHNHLSVVLDLLLYAAVNRVKRPSAPPWSGSAAPRMKSKRDRGPGRPFSGLPRRRSRRLGCSVRPPLPPPHNICQHGEIYVIAKSLLNCPEVWPVAVGKTRDASGPARPLINTRSVSPVRSPTIHDMTNLPWRCAPIPTDRTSLTPAQE